MATTPPRAMSRDLPDGISLDIDPEMRQQILKNEPMLQRALTAKVVGYYTQLFLLVVVTFCALGCLAFGVKDPIWPMIITYVLGYLNNRGAIKAGKYAKAISESMRGRLSVPAPAPPVQPVNPTRRMSAERT